MLLNIILAIVGGALVLIGADKLTDGSVGLARRFEIPEMVIGLTVIAFGTSLPEFVVSLMASIEGSPSMSIGNIVGSNLFNTLMIVGCSALMCPIMVSRTTVHKDIPISILASIVLPALAMDSLWDSNHSQDLLTRVDGVILLCFFLLFMFYTYSLAKKKKSDDTSAVAPKEMSMIRIILYIVLGIAGLIIGGELFVKGACGLARSWGVSEAVIGLTLVAGGTSLPELATSVVAARKGQSAMAIGNVIGSNLFNVFWILGFCATVTPLPVVGIAWTDFVMLIFSSVLFWLFSRTSYRVVRLEGFVLVACYVAYITWLILSL